VRFANGRKKDDTDAFWAEQMLAGLSSAQAVLGPSSTFSEKEIKDSLWHYYFDVDKAVTWLLGRHESLQRSTAVSDVTLKTNNTRRTLLKVSLILYFFLPSITWHCQTPRKAASHSSTACRRLPIQNKTSYVKKMTNWPVQPSRIFRWAKIKLAVPSRNHPCYHPWLANENQSRL
jgi:hypothetical protein